MYAYSCTKFVLGLVTLPTLSTLSYQSSSLPSPISVLVYIDLVYVFFLCVCLYVPSLPSRLPSTWFAVSVELVIRFAFLFTVAQTNPGCGFAWKFSRAPYSAYCA